MEDEGAQIPVPSPHGSLQGSAHGSPQHSPQHGAQVPPFLQAPPGGQGAVGFQQVPQGGDMAEMARMVAAAAAAAAEAARAATQAVQGSSSDKKKDLFRLIPKPNSFSPADREQEVSLWRDWYWSLRQYLLVVDSAYEKDLEYAERSDVTDVDWDLLDTEEKTRGRFLYSLLSTLLQGRLLSLVRSVEKSNGLEALRQLLLNCQPKARNRTMSMLQGIMGYPAFNMKNSIMAQITRLEEHFLQFEKLGGKLTDEMKSAVLLKVVSGPLKVHLNLSLNENSTYLQIREVIRSYDTATTKWTSSYSTIAPEVPPGESSGATPMEIDRMGYKGKDGGKKGKGKDGKGKSKGKDGKGKGQKGQGKQSQWGNNSNASWNNNGQKGQSGYGGDKGKGKGKNQNQKGGNPNKDLACFNCGRLGHVARDCWRVRQIGNGEPSATVLSSVNGAAESVGPSASQTPTLTVKRVAVPSDEGSPSVASPAVFDLRSSDTTSWCKVEKTIRTVKFFYIDEEPDEPLSVRSATFTEETEESYEIDANAVDIIIDSGADAPIFPASMIHCGQEHHGQTYALQDAQGRPIPLLGQRAIAVLLEDIHGAEIEVRDNVVFSNEITQPILSYGRLMDAGWSIDAERHCMRNGSYEIPLARQNHSLVVRGHVRAITGAPVVIRAVRAELSHGLAGFVSQAFGWNKEGNRWIGVHLSAQYQNPLFVPNIDYTVEWYRTTLIKKDGVWVMVEYCEVVSEMVEPDRYIEETPGRTTVVTFLTDGFEDVEMMGFEVEGWEGEKERLEGLEQEIQPMLDIPRDVELERREAEGEDLPAGLQELAEEVRQDGGDGELRQEGAQRGDLQLEVPQEGRIVVGEVMPQEIEVNGVVLNINSSLATLRAACGFYNVSKSGSKAKCYRRLCQRQKTLELLAAQSAIAQAQGEVERHPNAQALVRPPSQQEQELHELTHTPYAAWCDSCIKHRARPDQHRRTGESHNTGIPVISMDFAVTKKKDGLDPVPEGQPQDKGALWLVLTCSQSGYLGVIPIQAKNQMNYMTNEVMSFVQGLGYAEVGFYGDNEPTIRQILKTIITARHALGLKTKIYTTKLKDSAGNALAENSIQRIRQLACTLVDDVSKRTGLTYPCERAIWSWAGRHSAWCLNRFQVGRAKTSYEVAHGKIYDGKVCRFGEPIYAYCKGRGKADAKWRIGLFLGKTESQDAWIIGDGVDVMLSRSIRRVDQPWTKFLAYFSGLQSHSFIYQTNFGGRIVPTKRRVHAQRQEGKILPKPDTVERRFADEEAAAVMAFAQSREGRLESQREVQEALENLDDAPAGGAIPVVADPPAPPQPDAVPEASQLPQQPQPANAALLAQPSSPRASASGARSLDASAAVGQEEPLTKRSRNEGVLRRLGMVERRLVEVHLDGDTLYHIDEPYDEEYVNALVGEDDEKMSDPQSVHEMEKIWSDEPLGRTPPDPLPEVDLLAASIEVKRLIEMGVIEELSASDYGLDSLTTRMVYDWRIKDWKDPKSGQKKRRWMRRARLVAREYANSRRDDVHSPASGSQVLRLLPAIYNMMLGVEGLDRDEVLIGSLDVKDAFLMAEQDRPLQISTGVGRFKVKRNLPGQRIAAKSWYDYLASYLQKKGFEFCRENPCLGKRSGGVYILLHVDDMMFCGVRSEVEKLISEMKSEFSISCQTAQHVGDQFEFLKRTYILREDGMDIMPGRYAENMIEAYEKRYGPVKIQQTPCGEECQEVSTTGGLPPEEAALFRSLVGSGIYLSQERVELGFVIKQLASGMSNPSRGHLQVMRRLIGYLKQTLGYFNKLPMPKFGQGVHHTYGTKWVLETFSDADWSGDRVSRRSTSSAVHCLNGMVLHHSSRGQKVVSLSSAESELHGLVSSATDGIALRIYLEFFMDEKVPHTCLIDNSATRQISNKRGSGRLRHVSGKLLWIQDHTSAKTLEVRQVGTVFNLGDIGTKPLGRQRLQALMCWCNVHNKDGELIGEEEARKAGDSNITKAKIMRLAKVLQTMVLIGGLEQANGELIPFRMDLEPVVIPALWDATYFVYALVILSMVFILFIAYVVRMIRDLHGQLRHLQGEFEQVRRTLTDQGNEASMQHMLVTAMHVSLIRVGGYVNLNDPITDRDWENWNYVEENNRWEDRRRCRRSLEDLRRFGGFDRRRDDTPPRGSRSRDGGDDSRDGDGDGETRMERKRRYQNSTLSECSDPEEWMAMHHGSDRDDDGEEEESEETQASPDRVSRSPSRDTIYSEFLADEHLEYPIVDWSSSHDRAQLSALEFIKRYAVAQADAIRRSHDRFAEWCRDVIRRRHRPYGGIGAFSLRNRQ